MMERMALSAGRCGSECVDYSLITAGVYKSEIADAVNSAFEEKQGIPYKEALVAVAAELNLSIASVTYY
ncbi:hypothetical protein [Holdemanella biformis]|uniref:hypothetical protein n=1 Tax=Holdemanella biformis TaxID=1735 RepID=UPI001C387805|nr:hypothetical protein [Holdemanella biformis]MBV4132277.1 hypothetical protein [Holdemanella biformis]MBV4152042.1 hypothetical protein [Holdemanella biformis]